MIVRHILAGTEINPIDRDKIYLQIVFDQEAIIGRTRPQVSISNLKITREDIDVAAASLDNFPGITEGIPYDIEMTENGATEVLNMYFDCMNGGFSRSRDGMNVGVKMVQSLDNILDLLDSFTGESLYNEAPASIKIDNISYISYKDYFDQKTIYVPYVISSVPNYHDAFLALFALTYVGNEIYKAGKDLGLWGTPSVSVPAPVVHVAQIIAQIIYIVLLIVTLISLINQLIACLIQPVKYHGTMLVTDLMKVTCHKLGLDFQSSIWNKYPYNQIAFIPEKYEPFEGDSSILNMLGFNVNGFASRGYTSPQVGVQHGYYNGTGGDFVRLAKQFINGKVVIPDQTNTFSLERRDNVGIPSSFQLPDVRQDWNGYNTDELSATIKIRFASDLNDKNCIDNYLGTIMQATHQQITTNNKQLVLLKGLRSVDIPVARGIRKNDLTFIEEVVKSLEIVWDLISVPLIAVVDALIIAVNIIIAVINLFIDLFNLIISTINTIIDVIPWSVDKINDGNDIPQIEYISLLNPFQEINKTSFTNRVGALLLENDMLDTPKFVMVDTSRTEFLSSRIAYVHEQNQNIVNAKHLWDEFYFIDAFVGATNNRFTKISPALNSETDKNPISISLSQFRELVPNPVCKDNYDEPIILDSIQWYPERNGEAFFDFRKKGWLRDPNNPNGAKRAQEIAINLQLQISEPNGQ